MTLHKQFISRRVARSVIPELNLVWTEIVVDECGECEKQ